MASKFWINAVSTELLVKEDVKDIFPYCSPVSGGGEFSQSLQHRGCAE